MLKILKLTAIIPCIYKNTIASYVYTTISCNMDSFVVINQSCSNYLLSYPEYRYPSRLYVYMYESTTLRPQPSDWIMQVSTYLHIYSTVNHACMHGMEVGQKVCMPSNAIVIFACYLIVINTFSLPITLMM